jgi:hypothetical protein
MNHKYLHIRRIKREQLKENKDAALANRSGRRELFFPVGIPVDLDMLFCSRIDHVGSSFRAVAIPGMRGDLRDPFIIVGI